MVECGFAGINFLLKRGFLTFFTTPIFLVKGVIRTETDINTIIGAIIEDMTADGKDADIEAVLNELERRISDTEYCDD